MKQAEPLNVSRLDQGRGPGGVAGDRAEGDGLPELFRRFRSGDEAAFEEIVNRLSPRLYGLALRTLGNAEAAEEVVQESWVRIFNRARFVQDPQAFEGWAIRVVLSRINDEFRARRREGAAREGLSQMREPLSVPSGVMTPVEREDLARVLREALASLDEAHREVFVLREIEGLPHVEIARMLEIPEGTVWSRLSYARKALREYLSRRRDDV